MADEKREYNALDRGKDSERDSERYTQIHTNKMYHYSAITQTNSMW